MNTEPVQIMSPLLQYGFAGFSIILLCILVWLINKLLKVLKDTNEVIAKNTMAIKQVDKDTAEAKDVAIECKDLLLSRPCIAKYGQAIPG